MLGSSPLAKMTTATFTKHCGIHPLTIDMQKAFGLKSLPSATGTPEYNPLQNYIVHVLDLY